MSLQIEDLKIANVPVRVYRPKQIPDGGTKLTGVVFLHGGGWIFGSVGKHGVYQSPKCKTVINIFVNVHFFCGD